MTNHKADWDYSQNPNTVRARARTARLSEYERKRENAKANDQKAIKRVQNVESNKQSFRDASEAEQALILERAKDTIMTTRREKGIDFASTMRRFEESQNQQQSQSPTEAPSPSPNQGQSLGSPGAEDAPFAPFGYAAMNNSTPVPGNGSFAGPVRPGGPVGPISSVSPIGPYPHSSRNPSASARGGYQGYQEQPVFPTMRPNPPQQHGYQQFQPAGPSVVPQEQELAATCAQLLRRVQELEQRLYQLTHAHQAQAGLINALTRDLNEHKARLDALVGHQEDEDEEDEDEEEEIEGWKGFLPE